MASQLVWLITGTTSGLGRDLVLEVLKRGEKVIATGRARSIDKLEDLRAKGADILELDVTAPLEDLHEAAKKAIAIHGRVDVLVNNAGYLLVGAIEESSPQETLDQFNTNVFGALNVSRAFLPYMRERRSGTIVFIGSIGGWKPSPYAGLYCATKLVLRGISETLHDEISWLGLRSVCIDFGYFRTPFLQPEQRAPKVTRIADYKDISEGAESSLQAYNGKQLGNPLRGVEIIVDLVRGEGSSAGKTFPLSLALGSDCYSAAKGVSNDAITRLEEWKEVSFSTDIKDFIEGLPHAVNEDPWHIAFRLGLALLSYGIGCGEWREALAGVERDLVENGLPGVMNDEEVVSYVCDEVVTLAEDLGKGCYCY